MSLDKSKVKKILVIGLSNIGDVVLTFPVVDVLRDEFSQAHITMLVGPKAEEFFKKNVHMTEVIPYHKRQSVGKMLGLIKQLRKERFDLVIDLRNTAIPLFVGSKYHTPLAKTKQNGVHKKDQHLNRLRSIVDFTEKAKGKICIQITQEDKNYVNALLKELPNSRDFVVIAPGAANHNKRWPYDRMAKLADYISEKYQKTIIFVGDLEDQRITILIGRNMKREALDLTGKLSLIQLAYLIEQSVFFIGNDSAPMHIASYLEKPVLAFFGPTDPGLYGPWSPLSKYLQKKVECRACQDPTIANHDCIRAVSFDEAVQAFQIVQHKVTFK